MTTTTYPPILDTIQQFTPRPYRTTSNAKSKYVMRCPIPGHDDASASFDVDVNQEVAVCRSRCGGFNRVTLYRILSGEQRPPDQPQQQEKQSKTAKASKSSTKLSGATLDALARAKGLDAGWLTRELGWRDATYGRRTPAVFMPYRTAAGNVVARRYRTGIDGPGKDKYRWESGSKVVPYGLPFISRAQELGYIILVEGETDFAALHYHGFPALGIAGATNFKANDTQYLAGIDRVYVWQEPDAAGNTFRDRITNFLGSVRILSTPEAKDPCELAQLCGDQFPAKLREILDNAPEYRLSEPTPDDGPGLYTESERSALQDAIQQGRQGLNADSVRPSSGIKTTTRVNTVTQDPLTGMQTWTAVSNPRSLLSIYWEQSKEQAARLATGDAKTCMIVYRELPNYGHVDFPLFPMENRRIFPSQEDLTHWLEFADGRWAKNFLFGIDEGEPERNPKVVAQENCLANGFMACDEHGHRSNQVSSCGGKQCPHCGSARARSIGRVALPAGNYRIVWHSMEVVLGPQDDMDLWGNAVNQAWKRAQKALGRVNTRIKGRKTLNQSRLLHRTAGYHMDWPSSTMHVKCTYYEEEPGALDKDLARFETETGAALVWDGVTDDPTVAQLHMVGAATASLISVDRLSQHSEEVRAHLFAAYWHGTKGEHLNRALDWLEDLIKQLPKPEKPICDVADCGRELRWVLDTRPGDQTTNPSSPEYVWRHPLKHPS
jgi:hypothetical protein